MTDARDLESLFSTQQTADYLQVTTVFIRQILGKGAFPNATNVSGTWLIPQSDISNYTGMEDDENGDLQQLFTSEEVGAYLRVKDTVIWRYIAEGKLPGTKKIAGSWRIPKTAVVQYIQTNGWKSKK